MEKRVLNYFSKKVAAYLLSMTLILSGICFLPETVREVQASEGNYYEKFDIGNYADDAIPMPQDKDHNDWLFAGWFEDAECTQAVTDKVNATGEKYAKFVASDVLSVKCQVTGNTTVDTATSKLRIVTTVDNLSYQKMGFEIKIGNNKAFNHDILKVWKSIKAGEGADEYNYSPDLFHESSEYFATVTITNIPTTEFSTGLRITPYWKTLDGTTVYGVSRYARVEDSYLEIVNVPIRMYSDKQVAAGYLEVGYDNEKFEYYPNTDGSYDVSKIFGKAEAATVVDKGVVRCVASATTTTDERADGMYLNLRFKLKEGKRLADTETFTVFGEKFCNAAEDFVTFDVSNVVYKTLPATGVSESVKYGDSTTISFYELTSSREGDVNGDGIVDIRDLVHMNMDLEGNADKLTLLCKRLIGIE